MGAGGARYEQAELRWDISHNALSVAKALTHSVEAKLARPKCCWVTESSVACTHNLRN